MTVLSKLVLVDIKYLDTKKGEYNLGAVPNQLIDKFVHQINFSKIKSSLLQKVRQVHMNKFDIFNMLCQEQTTNYLTGQNVDNQIILNFNNYYKFLETCDGILPYISKTYFFNYMLAPIQIKIMLVPGIWPSTN